MNFLVKIEAQITLPRLYHVTREGPVLKILTAKKMLAGAPKEGVTYVSFTRNPHYGLETIAPGGANKTVFNDNLQLVFDRRKLQAKYKIEPFDYWNPDRAKGQQSPGLRKAESEERIVTKEITNIDRYLIKIVIPKRFMSTTSRLQNILDLAQQLGIKVEDRRST